MAGRGLLFITAVQFVDIPVMAAYLVLIAPIFVVINLIVDLLYLNRRSRACAYSAPGAGSERPAPGTQHEHWSPRPRPPQPPHCAVRAARLLDSDLLHGFSARRSPCSRPWSLAIPDRRASLRPCDRAAEPFDPATLNLMDGFSRPTEPTRSTGNVLAGTDAQGARPLLGHPSTARGCRCWSVRGGRLRRGARRHRARADRRLSRAAGDSPISVISPTCGPRLPGDPGGAADFGVFQGGAGGAATRAAIYVLILLAIGLSDWVQYAHGVRGRHRAQQGIRAGRARDPSVPAPTILLRHIPPT